MLLRMRPAFGERLWPAPGAPSRSRVKAARLRAPEGLGLDAASTALRWAGHRSERGSPLGGGWVAGRGRLQ